MPVLHDIKLHTGQTTTHPWTFLYSFQILFNDLCLWSFWHLEIDCSLRRALWQEIRTFYVYLQSSLPDMAVAYDTGVGTEYLLHCRTELDVTTWGCSRPRAWLTAALVDIINMCMRDTIFVDWISPMTLFSYNPEPIQICIILVLILLLFIKKRWCEDEGDSADTVFLV